MRRREVLGLALLFMAAAPSIALSSDLRILSGSGVQPVMNEIISQFERTSGHRANIVYGTVGEMAGRVQKGEVADMVIAWGRRSKAWRNWEKLSQAPAPIWLRRG
jgi:ABC-type molybdate transport system substrate-binding protein